MRDILPAEASYWKKLYREAEQLSEDYGYERIETPVLEETALYVRGVGKQTDIVEKEMYSFDTAGGEHVSLRPEGTAPIMRSYIHHGMLNRPQPVKLWYWSPMFRHDRPQSGRYREFWQFGCESLGDDDPVLDAQMAFLAWKTLKNAGVESVVQINSIGTLESRANYKNALVAYFRTKRHKLSEDDKKRLVKNPLRLLDSKEPEMQELKAEAPQIMDWLDEDSKAHFMQVLEYLDEAGVSYQLDPYLVRGLDYYTMTVFEVTPVSDNADVAKLALGGGGRYDGLAELLGSGRPVPACGFALGIERVVTRMKEAMPDLGAPEKRDVFVAQLGEQGRKKAFAIFEELRGSGIRAAEALSKKAIKAQMEIANKMGAKWAVIIGQKEVLDGTAIVRDMDAGTQEIVDARKVVQEIKKKLGKE
ncbi:histidine--tRNA ligase [Candidatus Uhrbacteria bacterium RIFCSPHIGHO2_12_FULL_60_25]|uniref:Histidine--tRNA ligase n=1 Tax=Candidatus Uhrbacteria bacterium RIFCSPHIGHO2_12_FULL_60_25 TaxID=1802399 RepID=A0A1F7UKW0_9BACT|nr:MAG: histidine--tRNA ligase [Candidatus Uhrbacteria bacterium RIFCSPHIGHO2_02_FULL_60_44]OGL78909.1 MAG: histidine--tRNA ligase [Candidatus Uhrbacteria bacterium RIFCSPHIGHO2_12_FULL_60_25]